MAAVHLKQKKRNVARDVIVMSLQLVFGTIAGVLICSSWLVAKPVTALDGPPPADRAKTDRHEVLFVRGKVPTRSAQGAKKLKTFLSRAPGELAFVEEDINAWFTATYGGKEPKTVKVEGLAMTLGPRVPSVRLDGDELELSVEIAVDREGGSRSLVALARGRFVSGGGRQVFVPRRIMLGSCPLPWNLGGKQLYQQLLAMHPVPENVAAAWSQVGEAAVADNRLRVVIPGATVAEPVAPAAPEPVPAAPVSTDSAPVPASTSAPAETAPAPAATP